MCALRVMDFGQRCGTISQKTRSEPWCVGWGSGFFLRGVPREQKESPPIVLYRCVLCELYYESSTFAFCDQFVACNCGFQFWFARHQPSARPPPRPNRRDQKSLANLALSKVMNWYHDKCKAPSPERDDRETKRFVGV